MIEDAKGDCSEMWRAIKQQQQQHTLFAFPITNGIAKV